MLKSSQSIQVILLMIAALVLGAFAPRNSLAQDLRPPGLFDLGVAAVKAPSLAAADAAASIVRNNAPFGSLLVPSAAAAMPVLKKGDFLLTRGTANPIPGYWNHVAIYDGSGYVIESRFPSGVKKTQVTTFINSCSQISVYRPNAQYLTPSMVDYAQKQIGQPYSNFNCVKLARVSYYAATLRFGTGDDPGWLLPDHLTTDRRLIFVGSK